MNAPIKPRAACAIIAATLAFSLIFAANAFAQEAEAERVIVTGSLIPTTEEVGSNPVSILNTSKLATLDLNIYSTDLFDLPAGGVGLAFGGVFIRESLIENPDDENRNKDNAGIPQEFPDPSHV